jgi:hypothetical protein
MNGRHPEWPRRLFLLLLGGLAALDLLILLWRIAVTLSNGRLTLFPAEGQALYAIWKVRHGYPLYEWPTQPYFALTYYNFLFYETYAAAFGLFHVSDAATPVAGRLVTLAFACFGAGMQYAIARRLTRALTPSSRLVPALVAVVAWTGGVLPGWWTLSIRPDIGAAALGACGVYAAVAVFTGARPRWLLAAGAAFAIAWTFKQSHVALFVATCVYVIIWRRSLMELALLLLPVAVTVAATLARGGAVYRANTLFAPSINPMVPSMAVGWYRSVLFSDLLLWAASFYVMAALLWSRRAATPLRSPADIPTRSVELFGLDMTYVVVATIVGFVAGAVFMSKVGSALNHAVELNVAAALLCAGALGAAARPVQTRTRYAWMAASLLVVPMLVSDVARLRRERGLEPVAEERRTLARVFATLPQPVYTDDDLFAMPWFATGNTYPTVILDHVFYDQARSMRRVGDGVEGLIARRYFGALVVPTSSPMMADAIRAGYMPGETVTQKRGGPLRVLRRP